MLSELLAEARADRPLWLPDLREAFLSDPDARPVTLRLTLHDGSRRDYPCALPRWNGEEERALVTDFFHACVNNCLTVCSGRELRFFFDTSDAELCALYDGLETVFQLREKTRSGYGKVVSIAGRIAASCGGGTFRFAREDLSAYEPLPKKGPGTPPAPLDEKLRALEKRASGLTLCGVDVGGTDIKLAASLGERLVCTKEYDWNPSACAQAEEIMEPILLLTRLMRACLAEEHALLPVAVSAALADALRKDAPDAAIREAVEAAESFLGAEIDVLDGVGLSYPDVVIDDRILGGETPKTDGMRKNTAVDYEEAFARLGGLKEALLALCREGGRVRITNDGNAAAFTAAMELAESENAGMLRYGVVAHSLGTDLGTGWLMADGAIPALPMELYDMILDLGSFRSRVYLPEDMRSTRDENSGLPDARRYMGQAAAYRLAWKRDPSLLEGFTAREGELLTIPTAPQDLRKPCLEHLMELAEAGDENARAVFLEMGFSLAAVTREMQYLLRPKARSRFLFGRFVKRPGVFALLREGFSRGVEGIALIPSDEELARTPLMRALAAAPDVTVAQFGQAVGAIYFALT